MNRLAWFQKRRDQPRFWWFTVNDYLPDLYAAPSNDEFELLIEWFEETERRKLIGECNVPAMSALLGFITGNGIDAIVQCGHYAGYSTLLLGWALKRMGKRQALFSMDIDEAVTDFTQEWIDRAGLSEIIRLAAGDSCELRMPWLAHEWFHETPQLVFIDSSHQYGHTVAELDLWYEALEPGGFLMLHDVSELAQEYDATRQGGVHRALGEWIRRDIAGVLAVNSTFAGSKGKSIVYQDGCGLGIVHKP